MIREKALFCKLFSKIIPSAERFKKYMESYRPGAETCPCCGCKGKCRVHAYYNRYILDFRNGLPNCESIRVMRVICSSCGHTHAVLPDFIVPYCQLSLGYLLQIIAVYCSRRMSIGRTCRFFCITEAKLYRLMALFERHKKLWLGNLANAGVTVKAFLRTLISDTKPSGFLHEFYMTAGFSFLQSHRNPAANCDGCVLRKKSPPA